MPETGYNEHYEKVAEQLGSSKDSIFEPCKILDFNTKTNIAKVKCSNSKQIREDVIVLFPSIFMNAGIIIFPVVDSTGMLFWGADKKPYLFPAQFIMPTKETKDGIVYSDASPGQYEKFLTLENLEAGEPLIRSLGGAHIVIRNMNEIELMTPKMHRLALLESDGSLETIVERTRLNIGNNRIYHGPFESNKNPCSESEDQHITFNLDDKSPTWKSDEVLDKETLRDIIDSEGDISAILGYKNTNDILVGQILNVFDELNETKLTSPIDGKELLAKIVLNEGSEEREKIEVSKGGSIDFTLKKEDKEFSFKLDAAKGTFKAGTKNTTIQLDNEGNVEIGTLKAGVRVNENNDLYVKTNGVEYKFDDILNRINELSSIHSLPSIQGVSD